MTCHSSRQCEDEDREAARYKHISTIPLVLPWLGVAFYTLKYDS